MLSALDHLALTTRDVDRCVDFYTRVLGMRRVEYGPGRLALHFGAQKINVRSETVSVSPLPEKATPGSLDLCFLSSRPLHEVLEHLRENSIEIVEGPVARSGAQFPLLSVCVRDPDGNLVEIAERARYD